MNRIRVAVVSSASDTENQEFNFINTVKWIKKAHGEGAELLLLPELSLSGYTSDRSKLLEIKENLNRNFNRLLEISEKFRSLAICTGLPVFEKENIYITQTTLLNGGIIHSHSKICLSPSEEKIFSRGETASTGQTGKIRFGVQICFETHFPELTSHLEKNGAELVLMPFASPGQKPKERLKRLKKFLPARAYDNTVFVAACNNIMVNKQVKSPALSMIIDPRGEITALKYGKMEQFLIKEIDLAAIEKIRSKKMSWFRKFAPTIYQ